MVDFNQVFIVYIMILVGINTFFAAAVTLPGDQWGDPNHKLFSDIRTNPDINKSMYTYVDTIRMDTNSVTQNDSNTIISTNPSDLTTVLFNFGNTITGGGLGYLAQLKDFILQMAFGYSTWIDYFLNPTWHPFVAIIGGMIKGVLFLIELFGIVSIFMALVGRQL